MKRSWNWEYLVRQHGGGRGANEWLNEEMARRRVETEVEWSCWQEHGLLVMLPSPNWRCQEETDEALLERVRLYVQDRRDRLGPSRGANFLDLAGGLGITLARACAAGVTLTRRCVTTVDVGRSGKTVVLRLSDKAWGEVMAARRARWAQR